MREHKTRRGRKGSKRSGTKRHQRGGGRFQDKYIALLREVNRLGSESKGLYADAKLKGCRGLESAIFDHALDIEKLLNSIRDFGRSIHVEGQALVPADMFKTIHHRKSDLDKMLRAGLIRREAYDREVARK